ncbi:hypothetical protein RYA05_04010 [Pseudomonas syringae pv. actinidiae]|nr:hypothetical protein [Pseudomonas syringae pv. actinidiae]
MLSVISSIIAGHLHIALTAWIEEEHSYSDACLVEDRNARVGACMIVANAITSVLVDRVVWRDIDCAEFITEIPHYWADRTGLIGHETTQELTTVIKAVASGADDQALTPLMGIVFEYLDATAMPYRRE